MRYLPSVSNEGLRLTIRFSYILTCVWQISVHRGTRHIARARTTISGVGKLERRAFVHSFHSQVFETLVELDSELDAIVAIDAHFDVHLPLKDILILMPRKIQLAATRVSAHTLIRRVLGGLRGELRAAGLPIDLLPEMFLVGPQVSLNTQVFETCEELFQEAMIGGVIPAREFKRSVEGFLNYLSSTHGVKVFTSPPKNC